MAAPQTGAHQAHDLDVSILVLLDWEWRRCCWLPWRATITGFQSLFCWIGNGGGPIRAPTMSWEDVSILVLLDWEWRLAGRADSVMTSEVSILVLLDWEWRRAPQRPSKRQYDEFQSLFCWIGNGGNRPHCCPRYRHQVSILVLLDWEWRPRGSVKRMLGAGEVSILVLLDWEWRRVYKTRHSSIIWKFQSLFCWIGNGGWRLRRHPRRPRRVSILVLLDWEWRPVDGPVCVWPRKVSILVLLDLEWRQDADTKATYLNQGFNPCSVGLGMAAVSNSFSPNTVLLSFNPCSVGLGMAAIMEWFIASSL